MTISSFAFQILKSSDVSETLESIKESLNSKLNEALKEEKQEVRKTYGNLIESSNLERLKDIAKKKQVGTVLFGNRALKVDPETASQILMAHSAFPATSYNQKNFEKMLNKDELSFMKVVGFVKDNIR